MELANLFSRRFAHTRLYETDRGVWIRFDPSQKQINLGTVHFNENDRKLYAIEEIKTLNILPNATKCHVALEFSSSERNGYVVGSTINTQVRGASHAWWFIYKDLEFGNKKVRIRFKNKRSDDQSKAIYSEMTVSDYDHR